VQEFIWRKNGERRAASGVRQGTGHGAQGAGRRGAGKVVQVLQVLQVLQVSYNEAKR